MGKIGRAILELLVDKKDLDKGLGESVKSVLNFEGAVKGVGKAIAGAFAVTAIVGAATSVVGLAGDLTDLSSKTAIGTEALQELKYAGSQVGVELETVTGGVTQLQKRLAGGDSSAVGAIKALGLNFDELRAKAPEDQFEEIAKKVAAVEDPADRVKLAMDLFGKSGAEMLPLLTDEFTGLMDRASELGIVMDEETIAAMDTLGDTVGDLMNVGMALIGKVLAPFIPLLQTLAEGAMWLADVLGDGLGWAVDKIGGGLKWLSQQTVGLLQSMVSMAQGVASLFPTLSDQLGLTQGLATASGWLESAERALTAEQSTGAETKKKASGAVQQLNLDYSNNKVKLTDAQKAQQKYNEELQKMADTLTGKAVAEEMKKFADALALAEKQGGLSIHQMDEIDKKFKDLKASGAQLPPELTRIANRAEFLTRTFKDTSDSLTGVLSAVKSVSLAPWGDAGSRAGYSFSTSFREAVAGFEGLTSIPALFDPSIVPWGPAGYRAGFTFSEGFVGGAYVDPFEVFQGMDADWVSEGKDVGEQAKSGFATAMEGLGPVIVGAFQGGGDVGKSIGAHLGNSIGTELGARLTKAIGSSIGKMLGSFAGPLGSLLGGFVGDKIGGLFSGNDTKKDREAAAKMFGFSSLSAMNAELNTLGAEGQKLVHEGLNKIGKKDTAANEAWIASVQALLEKTSQGAADASNKLGSMKDELASLQAQSTPTFQDMMSAANEFGVSLDTAGQGFQQMRLDEEAAKIINAFDAMKRGGMDVGNTINGMSDELQTFVADSLQFKTVVPENMRFMIEAAMNAGQLIDANGQKLTDMSQINFGEPIKSKWDLVGESVEKIVLSIEKLVSTMTGPTTAAAGGVASEFSKLPKSMDLEAIGKKHIADAQATHKSLKGIFGEGVRMPVHYDFDLPSSAGSESPLVGLGAGMTQQVFTVNHTTTLDGRVVSRNQIQHMGEAMEQAGFA